MTAVLPRPRAAADAERVATPAPLPDVPAGALHGRVRDQPVDGRHPRRRPRPRRPAVGDACGRPTCRLGHEVELIDPEPGLPDMVFAANGGLVDRRPRPRRPVHPRRAARRGPGLPAPAGTARPEDRHRAGARQRGRGRLPRRRRPGAGRHRLPHRPRRAHRGAGAVRRPGGLAAAGRPALLPPRHRAGRARRPRPSPTTRRRSARAAGRSCSGSSRTRSWPPRPTPSCLGLNAVSDGRNVVLPVGGDRPRRAAARARLRARSASTSPSCSRPAAASSAARWRSAPDRHSSRYRHQYARSSSVSARLVSVRDVEHDADAVGADGRRAVLDQLLADGDRLRADRASPSCGRSAPHRPGSRAGAGSRPRAGPG